VCRADVINYSCILTSYVISQHTTAGLGDTSVCTDQFLAGARRTVDLGTSRTAKSVLAGQKHVCSVLDNGQLKCWCVVAVLVCVCVCVCV
jgi:hypothetical protein